MHGPRSVGGLMRGLQLGLVHVPVQQTISMIRGWDRCTISITLGRGWVDDLHYLDRNVGGDGCSPSPGGRGWLAHGSAGVPGGLFR